MATKKQKRAAALAKHLQFMQELTESGLAAQRKDQAEREKKHRQAWQKQHDEKHSWKKRIKECPHCQDALKAQKKAVLV